ncbi:hypothetical protein VNO78_07407 [Psophocarpus tetragonolobus]|uniref:Uncharacterized protein n=1 Tax=Psophocarpus tetragonolobus TaxID=3891 RepID=A0AAN9T336_PSOTE
MFLSLNVCIARPLEAVEEASNTHIISRKVSENAKRQTLELNGMTNNIGAEREETSKHMRRFQTNKGLGFVPAKSVVLGSWRVPHSKLDQNPGFHSDYARPRTRPPSHN